MPYLVKLIGILFLVIGIVLFLKPSLIKQFIDFAKVGKRAYMGGVVRIVFGGILLLSIPYVAIPWITGIIGGIMVIAGILFFVLGLEKIHRVMDWIYNKSDKVHRIAACVIGGVGILLIYAA